MLKTGVDISPLARVSQMERCFPFLHCCFNELCCRCIKLVDFKGFDDPVVGDRIERFLVIDPCRREVLFLLFSVFLNHFVDEELIDGPKSVARVSFLFLWDDVVGCNMVIHS